MATEAPADLAEEGKRAYERGRYDESARLFHLAVEAYNRENSALLAAEMNNNESVAWLQAGQPARALEAARGTDALFASASDPKRQAMALGNQAAALEALGRSDEALETYARSEALFEKLGEGDMLAMVKKAMAAIRLKHGDVLQSALKMMGSVDARSKPSFMERVLKFLMRFKPW